MINWKNLDTLNSYGNLSEVDKVKLSEVMSADRVKSYSTPMAEGLTYNYAAKQVNDKVLDALAKLAKEAQLTEKFEALYNGEVVNTGEKRLVLHHMTRGQLGDAINADGVDKRSFYVEQQNRIAEFANKVHNGEITNAAGEKFTTVVQIGIGGSDLGPRAMYIALENWAKKNGAFRMEAKFISNVDPDDAAAGLSYNYASKQVDEDVLSALEKLADEAQLADKFKALYNGEVVNTGEKRLVLHHMTRGQLGDAVEADGVDKRTFYKTQQERIAEFANKVHNGEITNASGEKFTTVVQIGIGGSDLGPRAMYIALENWAKKNNAFKMEAKFISNVDPDDAAAVLASTDVAHSIFVLVSKSGTTLETLTNESFVKDALKKAGLDPSKHMIAVTSETSPLAKSDDYLDAFFMDDYIGGRFSSTSSVGGAVLSLAFGPEVFAEFLDGAAEEDKLSANPDMRKNPEMLDALIGVYERNVLGYPCTAVLPYSQALSRFPAHLQQLDMESNGKSVNRFGEPVTYPTGPVIFGEPGTNGQHSFYQLLHQGTDIVPLQFIGFKNNQLETDVTIQDSTSQQNRNQRNEGRNPQKVDRQQLRNT